MAIPVTKWTPVSWAYKELMTELKLDSQVGNGDFLRDRARNRILYASPCTTANEFDSGDTSLDDTGQIRVRLRVVASADDWRTNATSLRNGIPLYLYDAPDGESPEPMWRRLVAPFNHAWTETASSSKEFLLEFEWRNSPSGSWASLGSTTVYGTGFREEAGGGSGFVTAWVDIIAFTSSRLYSGGYPGWVVVLTRGLTVLGGLLNEEFSG